jgi:nucleotide-binding universal stress UspA family protein
VYEYQEEVKMYKKILVPLDGSKLAECALPHAEELAKGCNTEEVTLVSVTERVQGYRALEGPSEPVVGSGGGWMASSQPSGQRLVPEAFGKKEKQAQRYLDRIAKGMAAKGINVSTDVLLWKPAEAIVGYAKQYGCDLIIIASHGRSGPSRWTHGSVADKVLRSSTVPVLMIRAPGCIPGI